MWKNHNTEIFLGQGHLVTKKAPGVGALRVEARGPRPLPGLGDWPGLEESRDWVCRIFLRSCRGRLNLFLQFHRRQTHACPICEQVHDLAARPEGESTTRQGTQEDQEHDAVEASDPEVCPRAGFLRLRFAVSLDLVVGCGFLSAPRGSGGIFHGKWYLDRRAGDCIHLDHTERLEPTRDRESVGTDREPFCLRGKVKDDRIIAIYLVHREQEFLEEIAVRFDREAVTDTPIISIYMEAPTNRDGGDGLDLDRVTGFDRGFAVFSLEEEHGVSGGWKERTVRLKRSTKP